MYVAHLIFCPASSGGQRPWLRAHACSNSRPSRSDFPRRMTFQGLYTTGKSVAPEPPQEEDPETLPHLAASPNPLQVSLSSLRANISSLSSGLDSLIDPADALRSAMTISAVLEYTAEPGTPEEATEVLELKVIGQQSSL